MSPSLEILAVKDDDARDLWATELDDAINKLFANPAVQAAMPAVPDESHGNLFGAALENAIATMFRKRIAREHDAECRSGVLEDPRRFQPAPSSSEAGDTPISSTGFDSVLSSQDYLSDHDHGEEHDSSDAHDEPVGGVGYSHEFYEAAENLEYLRRPTARPADLEHYRDGFPFDLRSRWHPDFTSARLATAGAGESQAEAATAVPQKAGNSGSSSEAAAQPKPQQKSQHSGSPEQQLNPGRSHSRSRSSSRSGRTLVWGNW